MKLIPNYIHNSYSSAEKKFFKMMSEQENMADWFVLHSLSLANHINKREGEIDFLLIGPSGIFVLEVKGGRVSRKNGNWLFEDRFGRITKKRESPFTQAKTALYSQRDDMVRHFGERFRYTVYGYGVAFPDVKFAEESIEWDTKIVFDIQDVSVPLRLYINRLIKYWDDRQKNKIYLTQEDIADIVNFLRGDFETICKVSLDVDQTENDIIELTMEQYSCLDAMQDNPRILFKGSAGTGKTLLAMEKARRNSRMGIRTLFLCFNRLLGEYLKEVSKKEQLENVTIDSIHRFMASVIAKEDNSKYLNSTNQEELFNKVYPDIFALSWKNSMQYDELIIDEGQDIITPQYFALLNMLLKRGLDRGKWTIFVDPESQKNIFNTFNEDVYNNLIRNSASYSLSINCRNTKSIALQAEAISGFELGKIKKIEGPPVKYIWYKNPTDQANKISHIVNDLLGDGIEPEEITILSAKRFAESAAGSGRMRVVKAILPLKGFKDQSQGIITAASVHAYKGLENSIIILTDIDAISTSESRIINYVGFTRARSLLVVSINDSQRVLFAENIFKLGAGHESR